MSQVWDETTIQAYIINEVEEKLTLDYKAADSLAKTDGKKTEITKDVSAMANSAGGVIIYGIKEHSDPSKQHLPEKIDPVDRTLISREWLEQVVNNVRPKIEGIIIHVIPLNVGANRVVYVVEIPQSTTAHQAADKRYYKRFNFQSVMMEDHEIRDVMGRNQHPKIELNFAIEVSTEKYSQGYPPQLIEQTEYQLVIKAKNSGRIYAQYVNAFIRIPAIIAFRDEFDSDEPVSDNGEYYYEYFEDNTVRDVVDTKIGLNTAINKYGPARYDPVLPGLSHSWRIRVTDNFEAARSNGLWIKWEVYADNAYPNQGNVAVGQIQIIDVRKR